MSLSAQPASASTILATSQKLPTSIASTLVTNYTPPSGALYVATTGSDSNAGTASAPFATLAKAMKTVTANGTIVFRGGVYHQGASASTGYNVGGTYYFTPVPSGVTLQAYPGETVWFDGTKQITTWTKVSGTHFKASWATPDFCAQKYYSVAPTAQTTSGPCSYPDAVGTTTSLGDPQMLFYNGRELPQVGALSALTSSNFYYDWTNREIHINFDPTGSTVEAAKFAQAMALFKPVGFSIKGIGFRRYASNQFTNATAPAVLLNGGSNVLVERSVFTQNAGNGLISWQTSHLTVRQSILSGNGSTGFGLDGSWKARGDTGTTPTDDLTIEYSRLEDNNRDNFGVNCTYSCSAAGSKVASVWNLTIRYNSFSHNGGGRASGFWCDLGCHNLTAIGNLFVGNDRHGLVYEDSEDAVIASNLIADNGWNAPANGGGYGIFGGSARMRIYNNTFQNNQRGLFLFDDPRSPQSKTDGLGLARIGDNSVGIEMVNNIVGGGNSTDGRQVAINGGDLAYAGNTTATQAISKMSNNSYWWGGTKSKYWLVWTEAIGKTSQVYTTVSAFRTAKGLESNSDISTATTNPYLVSPSTGDYSVTSGSTASGTAAALPSDIATLLGVSTTGHDRGVIKLVS